MVLNASQGKLVKVLMCPRCYHSPDMASGEFWLSLKFTMSMAGFESILDSKAASTAWLKTFTKEDCFTKWQEWCDNCLKQHKVYWGILMTTSFTVINCFKYLMCFSITLHTWLILSLVTSYHKTLFHTCHGLSCLYHLLPSSSSPQSLWESSYL